ncbi:hypothetical protein [Ancylomarina euxinus]|uniref:hypothetical protein n=1 Tax=Ancylomarina euxinus TaxID=2283627 RepID=UPI000F61DA2B|nr:hypothetical protein [Ancylomarina euxinus]MCZ4695143.1 hypothetical protein [Ancylomarina euxinus]MUP14923.1 hypothetical protein [Ancylomarina euxinus]
MNISILTEHSLWWLLPIVLLAVALVYAQYYYKNALKNDLSSIRILILASLRALVYIALLFFLLNPRVKYSQERIQKPLLIWAQDNSQSLLSSQDSSYYKNKYSQEVDAVLKKLESKYEIQKLSFGQDVKLVEDFDFADQSSDYASLFSYLKNNIQANNQTQVVLAGDGLYNKGNDPRFSVQEVKCPVHTIALGDEADQKDISILSLRSNKLAFLKSNTPVRLALKTDFCSGEKIKILVRSGSEILYRDTLRISADDFFVEKDFFISPSRTGLQTYELYIQPLKGEANLKNNTRKLIIDVLDSQRKIAICYDSYHPDIAALQSALHEKANFSISLIDVSKQQIDFSDFNLMILYQLPSLKNNATRFFDQLKLSNLPFMMILGGGTEINRLNRLDLGLNVVRENEVFQNSRIEFDSNFSLFEISQDNKETIQNFPPLLSPMAKYQFSQEINVMGNQLIKGISTDIPLFVFSQNDEQKQCYILGEGIWRWKLNDYKKNNSHECFNGLINQMVQYLALRVKKNQLNIQYDKVYKETDEIQIEAQLYNKSYQATNIADIKFLLKNEKGEEFAYQFERLGNVYKLELNNLPSGNYQFEVKTKAFDQELVQNGAFVVSSEKLEAKELKANPVLLKDLSELTSGMHFTLYQMLQLSDSLLINNKVKSRISVENNFSSVLNFIWILCFVIIVLVLEWFLRKYWLGI